MHMGSSFPNFQYAFHNLRQPYNSFLAYRSALMVVFAKLWYFLSKINSFLQQKTTRFTFIPCKNKKSKKKIKFLLLLPHSCISTHLNAQGDILQR